QLVCGVSFVPDWDWSFSYHTPSVKTLGYCQKSALQRLSSHFGGEDFFHRQVATAAGNRIELSPAVGPNWIRIAIVGNEPFVIALLIAVINSQARENAVAIVLI